MEGGRGRRRKPGRVLYELGELTRLVLRQGLVAALVGGWNGDHLGPPSDLNHPKTSKSSQMLASCSSNLLPSLCLSKAICLQDIATEWTAGYMEYREAVEMR